MATSGSFEDRLASADHASVRWLNDAAFSAAPAGTFGNAPRVETDARTPRIINTDLSVQKNIGLGGSKTAQVKVEVINLFNRPQLAGLASTVQGNSSFGQINSQGGFMRMTQIMLRFSW